MYLSSVFCWPLAIALDPMLHPRYARRMLGFQPYDPRVDAWFAQWLASPIYPAARIVARGLAMAPIALAAYLLWRRRRSPA